MDLLLEKNLATEEAQQARLEALKGRKCLWITAPCIPGMSNQMKNSVKWVMDQGVEVWACFESEKDKLYEIMSEEKLFHNKIFANLSSGDVCENIVQAAKELDLHFESVFTPYEHAICLVGQVAEALEIPGRNPKEAYSIARSKNLTREVTKKAGLATPRSGVARTKEDVEAVVSEVGFPCILKPSSGAGSCGVLRADNVEEAERKFEEIHADLTKNTFLKYNPGCEASSVLFEQLLIGDEFDCDMLMWNGECKYIQAVDNWPCLAPFYLETGSQMPSQYPSEKIETMKRYAVDCVKALGFNSGCFHVEVMYTEEGPVLIEVNARQGGGPNQIYNLEMCGVDIFANYFMSMSGIPINPPRTEPKCAMADYAITAPRTGILMDDKHMEHIRSHPNVFCSQDFVQPNKKVNGLDSEFPQWVNQFVVKAETPQQCKEIIETLIKDIDQIINIQPEQKQTPLPDQPQEEEENATTSA